MNIKLHSSELNRIMKTIVQCVDEKFERFSNVEIFYNDNRLTIRGTNGIVAAEMFTPLLGGDGEIFCVDGTMFARVCAMCNGDVSISTTDKDCIIKGNGRTRLPIVNADVPDYNPIKPIASVSVKAEDFSRAYGSVAHSIAVDQTRIQLTGVLTEVDESGLRMTTIDGFRMAIETIDCDGDPMKIVIPGSFMKLIQNSTVAGETILIKTDGKRIEVSTEGMRISCGLLVGEFPDTSKIVPTDFRTSCLVSVNQIRNALKSSSVLNSKNNLVKISIDGNVMKIMSNSEQADYEAELECSTQGEGLRIAFNQKYLMETINSISTENAVMRFTTMSSPCVVTEKVEQGIIPEGLRMILPVRVAGV